MLRSYSDILDRLGDPLWFDDNGVPRYEPFKPDLCGVYDKYVCFMEIACQLCGERFMVAQTWDHGDAIRWADRENPHGEPSFPSVEKGSASFHYGDPPIHGCTGDTMNVECVRVMEFWRKDYSRSWDWERLPEYELTFNEHEAEEPAVTSAEPQRVEDFAIDPQAES